MAAPTEESIASSDKIEIDVVTMLRRRWAHIFLGVTIGVVLAGAYYFTTTPVYESHIEILVGHRSSEVTNRGTITGAGASGDAIHDDQLATHMRLFVSRKLLATAIDDGNLKQLTSFREAASVGTTAIDHILDNIDVERGGEGSARDAMVLRASFNDPNPDDAAVVLASIYESYRAYVESHGQNSTAEAVRLIEEARETHERELTFADEEYRKFVKSVPVLVDGEKVRDVHKDRLTNLEAELTEVRSTLAESTSRLSVVEKTFSDREEGSGDQIDHLALLSQNEVARLKLFLDMTRGESQSEEFQAEQPVRVEVAKLQYNRLLELIQKENSLSKEFGAGHPMVEAVRQEAEIARQFIAANAPKTANAPSKKLDPAEMLKTYIMLLHNDISELQKREEMLISESATELRLAKQVEADFMKGAALKAKLTRAQARYDQVILRLQELKLARSYAGFSTDVLAVPEAAQKTIWPNLPIIAALGCCLGMVLGLTLAVSAELVDSTFNDVKDLERTIGAPAIAHVPLFDTRELKKNAIPDSKMAPSLVSHHSPRSIESEVYRVARTSLLVTNRRKSTQTMMNTSPQPGDGKSTTISNLAISFAGAGKNVLLIDADMRRPVISGMFGIEQEIGLSDVLLGEVSIDQAAAPSEVQGLSIMPNGSPTSVPAELLESPNMAQMLEDARRRFDLILIDAPPLLAVADPAIIAPMVDSVVLTVRIVKNGRTVVEHARRVLEDIDVEPTAVIVNGIDNEAKTYYGYGPRKSDPYGYIGHYHSQYAARDTSGQVKKESKPKSRPSAVPAPVHLDAGATTRSQSSITS